MLATFKNLSDSVSRDTKVTLAYALTTGAGIAMALTSPASAVVTGARVAGVLATGLLGSEATKTALRFVDRIGVPGVGESSSS